MSRSFPARALLCAEFGFFFTCARRGVALRFGEGFQILRGPVPVSPPPLPANRCWGSRLPAPPAPPFPSAFAALSCGAEASDGLFFLQFARRLLLILPAPVPAFSASAARRRASASGFCPRSCAACAACSSCFSSRASYPRIDFRLLLALRHLHARP